MPCCSIAVRAATVVAIALLHGLLLCCWLLLCPIVGLSKKFGLVKQFELDLLKARLMLGSRH
jgi:hypothetical protein